MTVPSAITSVFQGFFLFFLLAVDVLVTHRIRFASSRRAPRPVLQPAE
jgi:ABC-type uncharacterized transport system permease subunit